MKAVLYNRKHPGRLVYSMTVKPVPGDDEILVKVHSVSLNAADYRSMTMGIIPKRKIFGADIAGEIESVGKNVMEFKPGERVAGDLASYGFGGLAEYVTAPERLLVKIPAKISYSEISKLPLAGITALQALRDKADIRKGQKVLVIGSSGGVGTFTIQLARYFGAEVTGVCSTGNLQQTLDLGAQHVIDYTKEDFTVKGLKFDIIIAINGNYPLVSCRKCLNPGGTFVMVGGSLSQIFKSILFGRFLSAGSKRMTFLAAKANKADLEFLAELMGKGMIKGVTDRNYPLDKAAEAMEYLRQGHAKGKVVINILP